MANATTIEGKGRPAGPTAASGDAASCPAGSAPGARGSGNRLLWIVAGGFALLLIAWTIFIVIASRHPVAPVPTGAGR